MTPALIITTALLCAPLGQQPAADAPTMTNADAPKPEPPKPASPKKTGPASPRVKPLAGSMPEGMEIAVEATRKLVTRVEAEMILQSDELVERWDYDAWLYEHTGHPRRFLRVRLYPNDGSRDQELTNEDAVYARSAGGRVPGIPNAGDFAEVSLRGNEMELEILKNGRIVTITLPQQYASGPDAFGRLRLLAAQVAARF